MARLTNKLFYVAIPVMLGLVLVYSVLDSSAARQQSEQLIAINERQEKIIQQQKESLEATQKDIGDLRTTILCIGAFFSSDDRVNLKVDTYSPCVITNVDTGATFDIQTNSFTSQKQTTPQNNQTQQPTTSAEIKERGNSPPKTDNEQPQSQRPNETRELVNRLLRLLQGLPV